MVARHEVDLDAALPDDIAGISSVKPVAQTSWVRYPHFH